MEKKPRAKPKSNSTRADLIFPVGRIHTAIKNTGLFPRVALNAAIYVAAVMEYMISEHISVANDYLNDKNQPAKRIDPPTLKLCIGDDDDFAKLLRHTHITGGGVDPRNFRVATKPNEAKKTKKTK